LRVHPILPLVMRARGGRFRGGLGARVRILARQYNEAAQGATGAAAPITADAPRAGVEAAAEWTGDEMFAGGMPERRQTREEGRSAAFQVKAGRALPRDFPGRVQRQTLEAEPACSPPASPLSGPRHGLPLMVLPVAPATLYSGTDTGKSAARTDRELPASDRVPAADFAERLAAAQ